MCQVNHRKFSPQNLHFNVLRLLCVVRSCFAHHLVSANTCKAKPHHSLDVYQPSPSFLPQGREREAGYQPAEAGFSPFFGARVSLLVFASVRDQVGKVWELRCCRIVETRPASLKVRAMHPEHRVIFFFLSFNWTRASCNRITPAIADRPARTFLYMCVRARVYILLIESRAKLSLLYFMTSSRHGVTVSEIDRQDQHEQILPQPSRGEPPPRAKCGRGECGAEPTNPVSAARPALRGRGCKKLKL